MYIYIFFILYLQLNENTPYLDGSLFYGPAKAWADLIREFEGGKLKALDPEADIKQSFPANNTIRLPMANPPAPREAEIFPVNRFYREYSSLRTICLWQWKDVWSFLFSYEICVRRYHALDLDLDILIIRFFGDLISNLSLSSVVSLLGLYQNSINTWRLCD